MKVMYLIMIYDTIVKELEGKMSHIINTHILIVELKRKKEMRRTALLFLLLIQISSIVDIRYCTIREESEAAGNM